MKKALFLSLFCLIAFAARAQSPLKGRVVDTKTNEPLEFVSVYLNTTTRGTTTNAKGEFSLPLPEGTYDVIVSYLGYEPIVYTIQTDSLPASVLFKLEPKAHQLGTVEIKGKRDSEWYANLEVFKENFLGRSWIARGCKLLNPEVLSIVFDPTTAVMTVNANGPLLIENTVLGYKLEYLLKDFAFHARERYVTYQGYPRYELMQGGRSRQRRWEKNRLAAYKGSAMHFVRALQKQQLEQEGFNLRRLYRLPNPNRPSDEEIAAARAYVRENGISRLDLNDSIGDLLARARLPRFIEQLDKNPVPYQEYLSVEDSRAIVSFENFMQVVYTGEKEEQAYLNNEISIVHGRTVARTPSYQTSVFSLYTPFVEIEAAGNFVKPLDVLLEGYWGWEKLGDMLPLDYQPYSPQP